MVDSLAGHRCALGSPPSEYAGRPLAGKYQALLLPAHREPYAPFPRSACLQARERRLHLILSEILWTKRCCSPEMHDGCTYVRLEAGQEDAEASRGDFFRIKLVAFSARC